MKFQGPEGAFQNPKHSPAHGSFQRVRSYWQQKNFHVQIPPREEAPLWESVLRMQVWAGVIIILFGAKNEKSFQVRKLSE